MTSLADENDRLRAEIAMLRQRLEELTGSVDLMPINGLARRESQFVAVIRAAKGRPMQSWAILEHIYGHDLPELNHVRVLAYRVRCKRPDLGRYIETVPGIGFRWDVETETDDWARRAHKRNR